MEKSFAGDFLDEWVSSDHLDTWGVESTVFGRER